MILAISVGSAMAAGDIVQGDEANQSKCIEEGFIEAVELQGDPSTWGKLYSSWGKQNIERIEDLSSSRSLTRVWFPAGTYDPGNMIKQGKPIGGTGYAVMIDGSGFECAIIRYRLRFSDNFEFVRGGKLPGLGGGLRQTYPNKIPRGGIKGFTARLMWREQGGGEVYAYLLNTPQSGVYYGESIGRNSWYFQPGVWYWVEEHINLNHPNRSDGTIQIFVNDLPVLYAKELRIRGSFDVKIDGLIFESFFGGNDPSWATRKTVHIDFSDISFKGYRHPGKF